MRLLIAAAISSSLLLTGCSVSTSTTPSEPSAVASSGVAEREASVRGSRLCFVKTGNGAVTVNPSPSVVSDPKMLSGEGGAVTDRERCFTGYNAFSDVVNSGNPDSDAEEDVVVDVSSPVGAIRMMATNYLISAPQFGFDTDFARKEKFRDGKIVDMSVGDKNTYTYKGYKFKVERRGDSADFKEFLVTFITPAN